MNVLLLEPCWENFGGFFRANNIARALSARGITTTLIIPQIKGIIKNFIEYNNLLTVKKIKNKKHSLFDRLYRLSYIVNDIKKNKYDIIHIFSIVHPEIMAIFLLLKFTGRKIFLDWDDYWQDSPTYRFGGLFTRWYIAFAENWISRLTNNVTVTSEFLSKKANRLHIRRILKIINGVDPLQFRNYTHEKALSYLGYDRNKKYILSFGNTYEYERGSLLIRTYDELCKRNNSIKLISNFDFRNLINKEKLILNEKILNNIIFTDLIPPEKLGLYAAVSECIVFLTGNTDNEKACFPVRIGSYLNSGKVIATNETDTEWHRVLEKFNCILIGKNPEELAVRINEFIGDKDLKEKMEENVKVAKMELSWDKLIEKLIQFYNSC